MESDCSATGAVGHPPGGEVQDRLHDDVNLIARQRGGEQPADQLAACVTNVGVLLIADDSVLAAPLGLQHREIGAPGELSHRHRRVGRAAYARGDAEARIVDDVDLGQGRAEDVRQVFVGCIGVDQELVAAHAPSDRARRETRGDAIGGAFDHAITEVMPHAIVDALDAVQIKVDRDARPALAEAVFGFEEDAMPVEQARHGVGVSEQQQVHALTGREPVGLKNLDQQRKRRHHPLDALHILVGPAPRSVRPDRTDVDVLPRRRERESDVIGCALL